ncbi:MAG: hypothetical protein E7G36_09105, partial [Peptoniphilus rhinitidis]|uniref:hypothetical protein n=2 Tax=Peptoniphilaceae TaxID=1570339 RepID=UPI002906C29C
NVIILLEKRDKMSLFLGHIHYMMYNKIIFQEEILDYLLDLSKDKENILEELDNDFPIEKGDLKNIIDENNIHGWLNDRVNRSENRLAKAVSILLKDFDLEELKKRYFEFGKNYDAGNFPMEVFQFITSKFLDGMPCDHALTIIKDDEDELIFRVISDVHKEIWQKFVDPEIYWTLRDEFIKGSLVDSKLNFENINGDYVIR